MSQSPRLSQRPISTETVRPKVICVDFDGCIAHYQHGYAGRGQFGKPVRGVHKALTRLRECGWKIIIHTSRDERHEILAYCADHGIPVDAVNENIWDFTGRSMNAGKPCADVYLDDRAVCFQGQWDQALFNQVVEFQPWHQTAH